MTTPESLRFAVADRYRIERERDQGGTAVVIRAEPLLAQR